MFAGVLHNFSINKRAATTEKSHILIKIIIIKTGRFDCSTIIIN